MPVSEPGERTPRRRSRLALAALFAVTGTAHVVAPAAFERIVPGWLPGPPGPYNVAAAVAELGSAALLANARTARAGGWLALGTLIAVWPANVQAALDGGYAALPPPWDSTTVAWLRVPLQVPLLWWAWTIARAGGSRGGKRGTLPAHRDT